MSSTWRRVVESCRTGWGRGGTYMVPHTECGDYIGDLVYRANANILLDECGLVVYSGAGGYGAEWAETSRAYVIDAIRDARWLGKDPREVVAQLRHLVECIDSMEDYPVLSEDEWSRIEWDALCHAFDELERWVMPDDWGELPEDAQMKALEMARQSILDAGRYTPEQRYIYINEDDWREALADARKALGHA